MNASNPYAPPGTEVADVHADAGVQPIKLWPPRGRIGRLRLLAYGFGAWLLSVLAAVVIGFVAGALGAGDQVASVVSTIIYLAANVVVLILRSHDMDWSGWWSVLALIPLVGLIWLFKPGTPGANRYGAPPPPNTLGVKILACVFPAIVVIGIVAAIALPAYQQYTIKARAAQTR